MSRLDLAAVAAKIMILERLLVVEEHVVHLPEPALPRRRLGGHRGRQGVRVDLDQREVPEHEANALTQLRLDLLDRAVGGTGVWALVVAVSTTTLAPAGPGA